MLRPHSRVYEYIPDLLWACPVQKPHLKNLCAVSLEIYLREASWQSSQTIFTAEVTLLKNYFSTGGRYYCGGDTIEELLLNWRQVLHALYTNALRLSSPDHHLSEEHHYFRVDLVQWLHPGKPPPISDTLHLCYTSKSSRSAILHWSLQSPCSCYPQLLIPPVPLRGSIAGRQSQETLNWFEDLRSTFQTAQAALSSTRTITLPRPNDQLWIVTDGSVKKHSIGATLYVTRNGKPRLAGFFSAKLRGRQPTWIPCEVEALSIAASTKHFGPFIVQSTNHACILTNSKPCVQAYEKLCRGEFSASPRISTFLSTVSRFQASIRHLAGSANIPSDFASRNAPDCYDSTCQVCTFVRHIEESTVMRVSAQEILSGDAKLPFTSRAAGCRSVGMSRFAPHSCSPGPGHPSSQKSHNHQGCQTIPTSPIGC